jgi:hypothetical protein
LGDDGLGTVLYPWYVGKKDNGVRNGWTSNGDEYAEKICKWLHLKQSFHILLLKHQDSGQSVWRPMFGIAANIK